MLSPSLLLIGVHLLMLVPYHFLKITALTEGYPKNFSQSSPFPPAAFLDICCTVSLTYIKGIKALITLNFHLLKPILKNYHIRNTNHSFGRRLSIKNFAIQPLLTSRFLRYLFCCVFDICKQY